MSNSVPQTKVPRDDNCELRGEKMFKRSRNKIILAIMGSLVLLFAITLSVILLASYREIRQDNMEMLKRYVRQELNF